ncbi:MAG: glycosyltransferase family 2 protein [Candidatus Zixiibacteriota bacterium]
MGGSEIKISIIVVTFNSLPSLTYCLAHLKEAAKKINSELIIVDNDSTDNSPSTAKNLFPEANILINRKNLGFAAACNQGARQANGNYLLLVNPDVFVDSHCLEEIFAFAQGKEKAGAIGGRLRFPDGTFQPACRQLPTFGNLILSRGSILGKIFRGAGRYTLPDSAEPMEVPAVAGTLLLIRKEVFEKVGRFDHQFFMYMEDTDLCKRLIMLGFNNYFVPSAGAVHEWGKGSSAGRFKRNWYHHRSVFKYFRKHKRGLANYTLLPLMLATNFLITAILDIFKRSNNQAR